MVLVPTGSELVAGLVAVPPLNRAGLPRLTPPKKNWTVPVGVPVPGAMALTVAVKVTDCPNTDGLAEDAVTVVADEAWVTVTTTGDETLPLKWPSPSQWAVRLWVPTVSPMFSAKLTEPPVTTVLPSHSHHRPVGVPAPGATAVVDGVNVMIWPDTGEVGEALSVVMVSALLTVCVSVVELVAKFTSPL